MEPIVVRVSDRQLTQTYADYLRRTGQPVGEWMWAEKLVSPHADLGLGFYFGQMTMCSMPGVGVNWEEGTSQSRHRVLCGASWPAPYNPIRVSVRDRYDFETRTAVPGGVFIFCREGVSPEEIDAAAEQEVFRYADKI